MPDNHNTNIAELDRILRAVLSDGVSAKEVNQMVSVAEAATKNQSDTAPLVSGVQTFDVLPDGAITLPDLVRDYGANRSTLQTWIRAGKLKVLGKVKAPAPGGGYRVVSLEQVLSLIEAPPDKGGRPPKDRQ